MEWPYICRVVPNIGPLLAPVKVTLHTQFLPAILGQPNPIDDDLHRLLSLVIEQGGLSIWHPVDAADALFQCFTATTEILAHSLFHNTPWPQKPPKLHLKRWRLLPQNVAGSQQGLLDSPDSLGRPQSQEVDESAWAPLKHGSLPPQTALAALTSQIPSGMTTCPSTMAGAILPSLTAVMSVARALQLSMGSTARKVALLPLCPR